MRALWPLAATLAVLAVGVTATTVAAQAGGPPLADCTGIQNDTVVVTDATGEQLPGEERLYPGTELSVVVCNDGERLERGENQLWTLDDSSVYERVGDGPESVHLRVVEAGANNSVSFADMISGRSEAVGPSVTVPAAPTARWNGSDGTYTLQFASKQDAAAFRSAADDYETAHERVESALDALPRNASAVDGTAAPGNVSAALSRLGRASARLSEAAFAATATGDDQAAFAVADGAAATVTETQMEVRDGLQAYREAVDNRVASVASSVRLFFAGGAIGGLVIGAAVGGFYAKQRREAIDFDQTYDSGSQRSVDDVVVPLAVGALLVIGGLAAPVVLGFLGVMI